MSFINYSDCLWLIWLCLIQWQRRAVNLNVRYRLLVYCHFPRSRRIPLFFGSGYLYCHANRISLGFRMHAKWFERDESKKKAYDILVCKGIFNECVACKIITKKKNEHSWRKLMSCIKAFSLYTDSSQNINLQLKGYCSCYIKNTNTKICTTKIRPQMQTVR